MTTNAEIDAIDAEMRDLNAQRDAIKGKLRELQDRRDILVYTAEYENMPTAKLKALQAIGAKGIVSSEKVGAPKA